MLTDREPNPLYGRPTISREATEGVDPPFDLFTHKPKIDSVPGGSEMGSMFGLGMKAPTHMLINMSKGQSNKIGVISEENTATSSRDSPPPPPAWNVPKPRESVASRSTKEEVPEYEKPIVPTCLSKEAETLFLEQHKRRFKAKNASTSKGESGGSDSKQKESIVDPEPARGPIAETMKRSAPLISESEKKPSSAGTRTETVKHVQKSIPNEMNKEAAALTMGVQPTVVTEKGSSVDVSKEKAKEDSISSKASPSTPRRRDMKDHDLSKLTKTNMSESGRANSVDDEGFESDISRSLDLSVQGDDEANSTGPGSTIASPVNVINVHQAQSTLPRAKVGSTSDTDEKARQDGKSNSMIRSDMAVGLQETEVTKYTGSVSSNTESSNPLTSSGKHALGQKFSLVETRPNGQEKTPQETTLRPLDSMRTPKPTASRRNMQGPALQSKQAQEMKHIDLAGPSSTIDRLKVPSVDTRTSIEKSKQKPESSARNVPPQPETAVLKLPQIDAKPKPGEPLAKNYLRGAPPTTLKFETEPATTKHVMEKRTKVMAKQFASLSLALPGKPGGPELNQAKSAKSKTAAKKKEKKVKVTPAVDPTEETNIPKDDQAEPKSGTPTSTSIGSQERPSSAISDVDV